MRLTISIVAISMATVLRAQAGVLIGEVHGPDGPVAHANVAVNGGRWGASTDANGRFRVEGVEPGEQLLQIRYLGYLPVDRAVEVSSVGITTVGRIELEPTRTQLDEVVVTGTMREVSRSTSTVPVEVITPKLFRRDPSPACAST